MLCATTNPVQTSYPYKPPPQFLGQQKKTSPTILTLNGRWKQRCHGSHVNSTVHEVTGLGQSQSGMEVVA